MSPMSEISSAISSTSTTAQRRKIKKPLIEKRRRLRINQCLANLKSLVLEATNKDENCFPKMEKADILEMTVAYMKTIKDTPGAGPASVTGGDHAQTYLSGYRECALQVCSFLMDNSMAVGGPELRGQLTRHLSGCLQKLQTELQHKTERSPQLCSPTNPSLDSGKGKKTSMDVDCRFTVPSSSSSVPSSFSSSPQFLSSSPVAVFLPSPVPLQPSPTLKAEAPKSIGSMCLPFSFPAATPCQPESLRDAVNFRCQAAATKFPACISPSSILTSERSIAVPLSCPKVNRQPNSSCLSPKKGDEYPVVVTSLNFSPSQVVSSHSQSTVNAFIREPIVDTSAMWRPW